MGGECDTTVLNECLTDTNTEATACSDAVIACGNDVDCLTDLYCEGGECNAYYVAYEDCFDADCRADPTWGPTYDAFVTARETLEETYCPAAALKIGFATI